MAIYIKLYEKNPHSPYIEKVVRVLRSGGVIVYPTDTVYALGCDITNQKALERVASIKQVKLAKANFSIVCSDLSNLSSYTKQINTATYRMLKRAFPGPFTFILKGGAGLPKVFKAKKNIGIRIPDSNIAQQIIKVLGNPIITTSIHHEDKIIDYMTDPEKIYEKYRKSIDLVIDAGYGGNVPSTIIDVSNNEIDVVRQGRGNIKDIL